MTVLTIPASVPSPTTEQWKQRPNSALFTTAPIVQIEPLELPGILWAAVLVWNNLSQPAWRALSAFVATLRGASGRLYYGPRTAKAPQASIPGTPVTSAAASKGAYSVAVSGVTPSAVLAHPGDYFHVQTAVARELKIVIAATPAADSGGNTVVGFEPPLHAALPAGAALVFVAPSALMGRAGPAEGASDDDGKLIVTSAMVGSMSLSLVERIPTVAVS